MYTIETMKANQNAVVESIKAVVLAITRSALYETKGAIEWEVEQAEEADIELTIEEIAEREFDRLDDELENIAKQLAPLCGMVSGEALKELCGVEGPIKGHSRILSFYAFTKGGVCDAMEEYGLPY